MQSDWRRQYQRYRELFLNIVGFYKKKPDVKIFLELFLSLATVSIFSIFALKPTGITIIGLIKEIKEKQKTLDLMTAKLNSLKQAQAVVEKEEQRIALLDTAIPTHPDPETFVKQIEGVAMTNPNSLTSFSLNEVVLVGKDTKKASKEEEGLPKGAGGLGFSLAFVKDYDSLLKIISNLENLRRPIKIDSLRILKPTLGEATDLGLSLSGQAPYFKAKQDEEK